MKKYWFILTVAASLAVLFTLPVKAQPEGLRESHTTQNNYEIFPDFLFVLEEGYTCYGSPTTNWKYLQCTCCNHLYVAQSFSNDIVDFQLFSDAECHCEGNISGFHMEMSLTPAVQCPCVSILITKKED
jgi:hypothetical protein